MVHFMRNALAMPAIVGGPSSPPSSAQDDAAAARLSGGASPANCGASCKSSLTFSTRPFGARYMSLETIAPLGNDPNASLRQSLTDRAHAGECGGSSTTYTKLEATILTERIRQ
jgi:hypothetical protein